MFGYAHVPAFKKHQRMINEAWLPDSIERLDQSNAISNALIEAGYVQIGLDHFALPDDEMAVALREGRLHRNFQGYTTDASNILLGFGASAIGHLPQGYVQNEIHTLAYSEAIAAGRLATAKGYALTDDDRLRGEIIERIMCEFGVDLGAICARHGSVPEQMLLSSPRLQDLICDGIVEVDGARWPWRTIPAFWCAVSRRLSTRIWMGRSTCIAGRFSLRSILQFCGFILRDAAERPLLQR